MASGVPVISTPVGMAVDLIEDMISGGLVDNFDPKIIAMKVLEVIHSQKKNNIVNSALVRILECDTQVVANQILNEIYIPLLKSS